MEVVSKYQPTILMSCNELYKPVETYQSPSWFEAKKRISEPQLDSFRERMIKTKKFLEEAEKMETPSELVHIKSLVVPIHDNSAFNGTETVQNKEVIFSFHYKKNEFNQACYQITATDPTDLFFHYTSVDITPEVFLLMTEKLHIKTPKASKMNNVYISRASGTFTHNIDAGGDGPTSGKKWFHDVGGTSGVVGVISGDFMTGVTQQPERFSTFFKCFSTLILIITLFTFRYQAKLEISRMTEDELEEMNDSRKPKKKEFNPMKRLDREQRKQPALKAVLQFTETLLFHRQAKLVVEFRETPVKDLQNYIQRRYSETKFQIAETQVKLDALLRDANARNLGLFSLLDRPNRNSRVESRPIPLVDERHRFGFERQYQPSAPLSLVRDNKSAIKEKSFGLAPVADVNPSSSTRNNSIFGPEIHLIPQRSVASMKIPVQSALKTEKKESRLYRPPTKIDPWFSKTAVTGPPRPSPRSRSSYGDKNFVAAAR